MKTYTLLKDGKFVMSGQFFEVQNSLNLASDGKTLTIIEEQGKKVVYEQKISA